MLLLVGAAGWFVWEQLKPVPKRDLSEYEPLNSGAAQARQRFADRPRNPAGNPNRQPAGIPGGGTVSVAADGTGNVRIDGARARFTKANGTLKVDLIYTDTSFQPPEDAGALMARYNATRDAEQAKNVGISAQQVEKLRAIPYVREMAASEEARKTLLDQWTALTAAAPDQRKPLEAPMIEHLRKTSAESISPTLANVKAMADQVRAILTTEQIMKLRR